MSTGLPRRTVGFRRVRHRLFLPDGRVNPTASRQEIASRDDFCEAKSVLFTSTPVIWPGMDDRAIDPEDKWGALQFC